MPISNTTHKATTALATIRTHWAASADPPRPTNPPTRTPARSRPPAPQAVLRADIINTLAYWTRALANHDPDTIATYHTDYPLDLTNPVATAGHLDDHLPAIDEAGWLHEFTREVKHLADQLRDLVTQPGVDRPTLGPCHLLADGTTPTASKVDTVAPHCTGTVRAIPTRDPQTGTVTYTDAACDTCRSVAVIDWWRNQWGASTQLVTTAQLVVELAKQGIRVKPPTIRWWLHTGRICSSGTTAAGDRLWDVPAVVMALDLHERRTRAGNVGARGTRTPETQPAKVGG